MPLSAEAYKPPLSEQITELQRKIQLLEGERTAFYESSEASIKKNRELILGLREENTKLYKKQAAAAEGDKHVVKGAFHHLDNVPEKDAFRNMSGKTALVALERKLQSKKKRLNAQKHVTGVLQQRVTDLSKEYDRLKHSSKTADLKKREEDSMKLRTLENNLEKTQLKCKEAESITWNYLTLKSQLQDESLDFPGQLDSLEAEILKHREELQNLQTMNREAQMSAEAAKAQLQQREELIYKDRKERERYKNKVEEQKTQAEKVERRAQRMAALQPDDLSEAQRSNTRTTGDEDKTISTFEDVLQQIKEATGVTDIQSLQEIAERFVTQKGIHEHLEKLAEENKITLVQLKEQKEKLNQQFEEKKYSGEGKISTDQSVLEDCEQQLQSAQRRCDEAKESVSALDKTLTTVQAGVEHLADKLQHITPALDATTLDATTVDATTVEATTVDATTVDATTVDATTLDATAVDATAVDAALTDSELVDLLSKCELKLQSLYKELPQKDLSATMKAMDDDKFFLKIEGKLPTLNTRIHLPEDQRQELFDDEEESGEDEAGAISREALKRESQMIVDSKLKKKPWKKK